MALHLGQMFVRSCRELRALCYDQVLLNQCLLCLLVHIFYPSRLWVVESLVFCLVGRHKTLDHNCFILSREHHRASLHPGHLSLVG
jgi:hypothetical protein